MSTFLDITLCFLPFFIMNFPRFSGISRRPYTVIFVFASIYAARERVFSKVVPLNWSVHRWNAYIVVDHVTLLISRRRRSFSTLFCRLSLCTGRSYFTHQLANWLSYCRIHEYRMRWRYIYIMVIRYYFVYYNVIVPGVFWNFR